MLLLDDGTGVRRESTAPCRFIARGRARKTPVGPELTSTMEIVAVRHLSHASRPPEHVLQEQQRVPRRQWVTTFYGSS